MRHRIVVLGGVLWLCAACGGGGSTSVSTAPASTSPATTVSMTTSAPAAGTVSTTSAPATSTGSTTTSSTVRLPAAGTATTAATSRGFTVDQPAGQLFARGTVCALDQPFSLEVTGQGSGTVSFVPDSASGGTYSTTISGSGATLESKGDYRIDAGDGSGPVLRITKEDTVLKELGRPVPGFFQGVDIRLVPGATGC